MAKHKGKTKRKAHTHKRNRSRRNRSIQQKGGACLPCLGIPPIAKALGLTALGSLALKNSYAKRNRSGEFYKTILKKHTKSDKLQKVTITLKISRDKAILKKNNRKIKIKGDPKKHYEDLIKRCELKGFDKC